MMRDVLESRESVVDAKSDYFDHICPLSVEVVLLMRILRFLNLK